MKVNLSEEFAHTLRTTPVGVATTIVSTAVLTAILAPFQSEVGLLNEGLLFLLLTLLISSRWGWQVGLFAAITTNLTLNFFFVEPLHEFTVQDPANVFALGVFLLVSVLGGSLLSAARTAAAEARRRAAETQVLLGLSRAMIGQTDPKDALTALCDEVIASFRAPGAAVMSGRSAEWYVHASAGDEDAGRLPDTQERVIAGRALETGAICRLGNTGLSRGRRPRVVRPAGPDRFKQMNVGVAFVPLRIGGRTLGVLRIDGPIGDVPFREHPDRLITAFASEAAMGVQRAELAQAAAHAHALMEADEMKSALMTSISHDLKTPLAGIKTSVSSLLDASVAWSEDDRRAFLETIDSQSDRLNRVISDILDLNRIESGAVAPAPHAVYVASLFEEVLERTMLVTAGRHVIVNVPPDVVVEADESLIVQALVNLVENAAKYSIPGGAIKLGAEARERVDLVVEDEGPGIAPEDLPHVFERFYRAGERSRRVKGSGLGLAIVKGFVALSGGSVRVESTHAGTRFIISLPTTAAAPA